MDARMEEVYAAHYRHDEGKWRTVVAPALCTLDELHAHWQRRRPQSVAGTAPAVFGPRLDIGSACVTPEARPYARALLACAQTAWDQGLAADAATALPHYLRDRVALTSAEREAGKCARAAR
jgi:tRNA threonylcarbamoyladenosine biosynthesis protein TsaB